MNRGLVLVASVPVPDQTTTPSVTVYRGRAGDHNELGARGAESVGSELARRLETPANVVGEVEPVLDAGWEGQLEAARPALAEVAARVDVVLRSGSSPVTAISRCAVSLATVPVVAARRPDAVVVWLDAHADLNTPESSTTGYLGGMALSGPLGLWDSGFGADLSPDNVVLVGARDIDAAEQRLIDDSTITLVPPGPRVDEEVRRAVAGRPVYFHLDCDVLEPGTVPTDYQVSEGLSLSDLRAVASALAESEVVGIEIGEFQSSWETGEAASPAPLLDALWPLVEAAARHG